MIRAALRQLAPIPVVQLPHRTDLEAVGVGRAGSERHVVGHRAVEVGHVPRLLGVRPRLTELLPPLLGVETGPDVVEELPASLELPLDRGQGRDRIDRHVAPPRSVSVDTINADYGIGEAPDRPPTGLTNDGFRATVAHCPSGNGRITHRRRRMRGSKLVSLALAIIVPLGCGGGGGDDNSGSITNPNLACSPTANGTFSATLNGQTWVACGQVTVRNDVSFLSAKDTLRTVS